ncbi:MAG: 50S ribosomal protein L25, partial [Bacillota bacterium]
MKESVTVAASLRETGHPVSLRSEGYVPVMLYGRDVDNVPLKVSEVELNRLFSAGGQRGLLELEIEDFVEDRRVVMIREIQRDPVERRILHVDLYQVDLEETLTTSVPVQLLGEETATSGIEVLQHGIRELTVQCLPRDIPDRIPVDISEMTLGDSLTVADVEVPEGVEVLNDPTDIIVTLVQPRLEVEEPEEEEELLADEEREP